MIVLFPSKRARNNCVPSLGGQQRVGVYAFLSFSTFDRLRYNHAYGLVDPIDV